MNPLVTRISALACAAIGAALVLGSAAGPAVDSADAAARKARLVDGRAKPPDAAPRRVKRAIRAGNRIAKGHPYCYGGGHARWRSRCYDCSGAVSYVLGDPGARVLNRPKSSVGFMRYRKAGRGKWITVFANRGHAYVMIAGLRFDTSMTKGAGPGWSDERRSGRGFRKRHPARL